MAALASELQPNFQYSRHKPEATVLYQIVQSNLANFIRQVEEEKGFTLPDFVLKEFQEYLECGILAHGFLRLRCEDCNSETFLAFSCKRRGFCPSCGGRRMNETATHLVDEVLPYKRIRQWVLSFPIPVRLILAVKPKSVGKILNIANSAITNYYSKKAGMKKHQCQTGSVTLIQRFGGSINLNVHFHTLFIDGVYELNSVKEPSSAL